MLGNQKVVVRSAVFSFVFAAILLTSHFAGQRGGAAPGVSSGNHPVLSADGTGPQPKPIPMPAPWSKAAA